MEKLLNKLHFAFTDRQKPHLAVAIYESEEDKQYYCQVVQEKMAEYQHLILDASGDKVKSLVRYLQEKLPQEVQESDKITQFVHIWGLENSFYEMEDGKLQPSLMLPQINLERELIFRNQPILLLLWLTPSMVKHFQQKAIDFWDWITDKFHFEARYKDSEPLEYDTPLEAEHFDPQVLERIAELEQKLKYQDASEINARYFKQKRNILTLLYTEEMKVNRWDSAIKHIQQLQNILDKTQSSKKDELDLWVDLARVYYEKRDFSEAHRILDKALSYKIEEHYGLIFHRKGMVYQLQRQWSSTLENYEKAIEWNEQSNNVSEIGGSYHQIGIVYFEQRQWTNALENYQKAIEWYERSNNLSEIGGSYHQIGRIYEAQRQWTNALENYQKAIEWNEQSNNLSQIGSSYHQIGIVYFEQRQWTNAFKNYQKAIEWKERSNNVSEIGSSYHQIGYVYQEQRQWTNALENYEKAIEWYEKSNNLSQIGGSYHSIANIYLFHSEWQTALEYYVEAEEWYKDTNNPSNQGLLYQQMALAYQGLQDYAQALDYFRYGIEASSEQGNYEHLSWAFEDLRSFLRQKMSWTFAQRLEFYQEYLADTEEDEEGLQAFLHQEIAILYQENKQSLKALPHAEKALKLKLKHYIDIDLELTYTQASNLYYEFKSKEDYAKLHLDCLQVFIAQKQFKLIKTAKSYLQTYLEELQDPTLRAKAEELLK